MKSISDVNEINKILKQRIELETGLSNRNVRNALSTYGETLHKLLTDKKFNSYELNDAVILFDLHTRDNPTDVSIVNENSSVDLYKSYEFKIIIYGHSSANLGNILYARFNTDYVLSTLQDEGIYLESISLPMSINEFINDVMWPRTDLSFLISCKHTINQIHDFEEFEKLSELDVDKISMSNNSI